MRPETSAESASAGAETAPPQQTTSSDRTPEEASPASGRDDTHPIHILSEEGLLAARDLEEVRAWIFEGRIWPDNLVYVPGGHSRKAIEHPLTRSLFTNVGGVNQEDEEKPEPPPSEEAAHAAGGSAAPAVAAWDPSPGTASDWPATVTQDTGEAEAAVDWSAPAAESGPDYFTAGTDTKLPAGVRRFGILNFAISLILPPNPFGIAAAVGLLRGRAWGRTLTITWAGTQLFMLLLVWSGLAVLTGTGGADGSPVGGLAGKSVVPLLLGTLAFGALAAYFIVQWIYLGRSEVTERFEGGREREALWGGWLGGALYIAAVAFGAILLLPRLDIPRFFSRPDEATVRLSEPVPATAQARASGAGRVYTADGLLSIEAPSPWTVNAVTGGDDAKLGVLLQGSRKDPAGKLRVSSAKPREVERMNKRFDTLETDEETIRSVEAATLGILEGRRIVLWSKVPGGMTGQILLSLSDDSRGYQFSCAAPGPGFEAIREECDLMAKSLVITRTPQTAVPAAAAGDTPPEPSPEAAAGDTAPEPSPEAAAGDTPPEPSPEAPAGDTAPKPSPEAADTAP